MQQVMSQPVVFKKLALAWAILLILAVCYPLYEDIGVYVGVGVFFYAFLLFNMGMLLSEQVAIPHLMAFNYFFQLFFASLVLYFYPPPSFYDIGKDNYPAYLSYAVPACIALYLGAVLAMRNLKPVYFNLEKVKSNFPAWACHAKVLFYAGLFFYLVSSLFSNISALAFVFVLLAALRYVGLFALILSGARRWWIYAVIVLALQLVSAASHGMFIDLVLWGAAFFLIVAYRYKWKARAVLVLVVALVFLTTLQSVKSNFRKTAWRNSVSASAKLSSLGDLLVRRIDTPGSIFDAGNIAVTFVRFNQGWIVNRVIQRVPDIEPYAYGETIIKDLYAAFVPRVLAPDKAVAGGVQYMDRFAGIRLEGTSMNIGVAGEMYANFGIYGGVLGMGVFGYFIGFLYSILYKKAAQNPVWWAWGPFVGLFALKGEEGFMEITGWIVKSIIVMATIIFIAEKLSRRQRIKTKLINS